MRTLTYAHVRLNTIGPHLRNNNKFNSLRGERTVANFN